MLTDQRNFSAYSKYDGNLQVGYNPHIQQVNPGMQPLNLFNPVFRFQYFCFYCLFYDNFGFRYFILSPKKLEYLHILYCSNYFILFMLCSSVTLIC
jgi:hypothetical protein